MLMKLCILSWNVKRINEGGKHKVIKFLIRMYSIDLACLQVTKVQQMLVQMVSSLSVGKCQE